MSRQELAAQLQDLFSDSSYALDDFADWFTKAYAVEDPLHVIPVADAVLSILIEYTSADDPEVTLGRLRILQQKYL